MDDTSSSGSARRAAMRLAERLGFNAQRIGEVGIVTSEAAMNILHHVGGGTIGLQVALRHGTPGVEIVAIDRGPGMVDVPASSVDGRSTVGTLGLGLGTISRLATSFDVSSQPDKGTVLVARLWPGPVGPVSLDLGGVTRPISSEVVCGDTIAARSDGGRQLLLVADGLGHGPLAATASQEAVAAFHALTIDDPGEVLAAIHQRIRHTRGAAVAVAAVEAGFERVTLAGVGNISAFVQYADRRQAMLSSPGIVGHKMPTVRLLSMDLDEDAMIVLHSDGLTERWNLDDVAGLRRRSSTVIAATLLRDAATRRDDASVLVARRTNR